jgi:hypothetical protein
MTSRADADDDQLGDANWVDAATLWKQNRIWLVICQQKINGSKYGIPEKQDANFWCFFIRPIFANKKLPKY